LVSQVIPPEERKLLLRIAIAHELCSPRELQVLRWWADDVGIRRTAVQLGIHESTVRTHRARALESIRKWMRADECAKVS
jgi:DNA-binding CsgD family transcriptional regulator